MTRAPRLATAILAAAPILLLAGCEFGPKEHSQTGFRGTGMNQIHDPDRRPASLAYIPPEPYELPADEGPKASEVYQNVQVLGGLSAERFNHLMSAITAWVSPEQGCAYCHNLNNMASDEVYTKAIARRMIQMTWTINGKWAPHVQKTGVTCWTCHRGQPVPQYHWNDTTLPPGHPGADANTIVQRGKPGQNDPQPITGFASLPYNWTQLYLQQNPAPIRVNNVSTYPTADHRVSTKHAEETFAFMIHMSEALGVNCVFCHNSRQFASWNESTPQRVTAWHGIHMVQEINSTYINPLAPIFPANRKGPLGDPYKVNCLTCHQGLNKPLNGVSMIPAYPYMRLAPVPASPAIATAASVAQQTAMAPAANTGTDGVAPKPTATTAPGTNPAS